MISDVGVIVETSDDCACSITVTAAMSPPIPHAMADSRPALTPMSRAVARFSATARICAPVDDRKNMVIATAPTSPTTIDTICETPMDTPPPTLTDTPDQGAGKLRGSCPQIRPTTALSASERPIVMSSSGKCPYLDSRRMSAASMSTPSAMPTTSVASTVIQNGRPAAASEMPT